MRKLLRTSLLTTMIVVFSLYLAACGKDDKSKPAAEKSSPAQTAQPTTKPATKPTTKPEKPAPVTTPPVASTTVASTTKSPAPEAETAPVTPPTAQQPTADNGEMLKLARKSGCLSCHMVDKKIVGPAWKDVAARYKGKTGARALLIEKVSNGGRGNWKDVVGNAAMPPYFPRVSKENIGKLVDFVLSLQ
jgi:cytochrome c